MYIGGLQMLCDDDDDESAIFSHCAYSNSLKPYVSLR